MQVNVNHSGSTLFDVTGSSTIVSKVLIAYFEDQGMIDGDDDRNELHTEIFGKCVDAMLNNSGFLCVGLYLVTFDK